MQAEEIFTRVAEKVAQADSRFMTIVDCQIRPAAISQILANAGLSSWISVLLHCPEPVRERRLLARNWAESAFPRVENWARILLEEAGQLGHLVIDTSRQSTEQICATILKEGLSR